MDKPSSIHPIAVYVLRGLVWRNDRAICLDVYRGYIVEVDPLTESVTVLNSTTASQLRELLGDAWLDTLHGITLTEHTFWLTHGNCVYCASMGDFEFQLFAELPEMVQGRAVSEGGVYLSSRQAGKIFMLGRSTRTLQRVIPAPGTGFASLTLHDRHLWVCDQQEETVYCLDARTGQIYHRALTPFPSPVGIGFWDDTPYVVYANEERYIAENPNQEDPYSIAKRDRSFLHQLKIQSGKSTAPFTLSNGYLVEMVYVEETYATDPVHVQNLTCACAAQ
jgi:hypothetical protein